MQLLGGKLTEITAGFTRLLVKKGREEVLPEIINAFIEQYKKHKEYLYSETDYCSACKR